ncbi:hypothetical protein DBV15_08060, partial [Temnothorax longispinosus]
VVSAYWCPKPVVRHARDTTGVRSSSRRARKTASSGRFGGSSGDDDVADRASLRIDRVSGNPRRRLRKYSDT